MASVFPTSFRATSGAKTKIFLHTENGLLGVGPRPTEDKLDPDLVDAAKRPITALPGASYFDSASSFAMIRGGHVDVAVLGALQVSERGDIANWAIPGKDVLGVGGAMDLVVGAGRVIVTMTSTTPTGGRKLICECSFPLTAREAVDVVVTELAVFRFREGSLFLTELLGGATLEDVGERRPRRSSTSSWRAEWDPASPSSTRVRDSDRGIDPPYLYPAYVSTRLRSPKEPLIVIPHTLSELTGPVYGDREIGELDHDLTRQHDGEPLGQRIVVRGRVSGRRRRAGAGPADRDLAGGTRQVAMPTSVDTHDAPLDPNFSGGGRCLTGDDGELHVHHGQAGGLSVARTIRMRGARITSTSRSSAGHSRSGSSRRCTSPAIRCWSSTRSSSPICDGRARERLVSTFDLGLTTPAWALGYRFDIVVGGRDSTPFEEPHDD